MKRNRLARAAVLAGIAAGAAFGAPPAVAGEIKAVIELFTSQGCSSCPPADKLLGEYADRDDLLALSFNVDYWDSFGWKDTLASPDNTARQDAYSAANGNSQRRTPEFVVNGRDHVEGASAERIAAALRQDADGLAVPIALSATADAIAVNIGQASVAGAPHATLWLVLYERSVAVPIGRGENQGRTITYSNVVRKLRPIEMWKGEAMSVDLPKSEMTQAKVRRCAVLLQAETATGLPGPVLGAAAIDMGE